MIITTTVRLRVGAKRKRIEHSDNTSNKKRKLEYGTSSKIPVQTSVVNGPHRTGTFNININTLHKKELDCGEEGVFQITEFKDKTPETKVTNIEYKVIEEHDGNTELVESDKIIDNYWSKQSSYEPLNQEQLLEQEDILSIIKKKQKNRGTQTIELLSSSEEGEYHYDTASESAKPDKEYGEEFWENHQRSIWEVPDSQVDSYYQ